MVLRFILNQPLQLGNHAFASKEEVSVQEPRRFPDEIFNHLTALRANERGEE